MIKAISPLDGRYVGKVKELKDVFSEAGLIRARMAVEIEWLIFLCNELKLEGTGIIDEETVKRLRKLYLEFKAEFAKEIKEIEKETNHDVKAIEYFLQKVLKKLGREDLIPFIHFACTSEDINNLAYAQMLHVGLQRIIMPKINEILDEIKELSETYKDIPMMSRTHGQPASPTSVGKEFKNIGARLFRQFEHLKNREIMGKMNGASGNFNAHVLSYPEVNWPEASKKFIESLGLKWQKYTTQIEPHDYISEIFDNIVRINNILLDMDRDMWLYISYGYFKQKTVKDEVGSSTMPHKVNPIDFENSEGNLGLANAMFSHMSGKLQISRMQRDLSDSTVLRNMGSAFGYSLLAYKSSLKGLDKIDVNEKLIMKDLDSNWSLLAEPIQMMMRRYKIDNAYEKLKEITRGGEPINKETLHDFVKGLDLPEEAKTRLMELTPSTYTGLAKDL